MVVRSQRYAGRGHNLILFPQRLRNRSSRTGVHNNRPGLKLIVRCTLYEVKLFNGRFVKRTLNRCNFIMNVFYKIRLTIEHSAESFKINLLE